MWDAIRKHIRLNQEKYASLILTIFSFGFLTYGLLYYNNSTLDYILLIIVAVVGILDLIGYMTTETVSNFIVSVSYQNEKSVYSKGILYQHTTLSQMLEMIEKQYGKDYIIVFLKELSSIEAWKYARSFDK